MALLNLGNMSTVDTGNEAVAQGAINDFIASKQELSSVLIGLFQLENMFRYQSTMMLAQDTRSYYDQLSNQMIARAIGGGVLGLFEVGGAGVGIAMENRRSLALKSSEAELENMKSYRKAAQTRLEKDPGKFVTSRRSGIDAETKAQIDRMKELEKTTDYSKLDLDRTGAELGADILPDHYIIENSEGVEAQALSDKLDELIKNKEDTIAADKAAGNQRGVSYNQMLRGVGQIGNAFASGAEAYYQQETGKFDSEKSIDQSTLETINGTISELMRDATQAIDSAGTQPEVLVTMSRGDVYTPV